MLANLRALFGVVVDIVLLRRGPEHLPASPPLLVFMIALFATLTSLVAVNLPRPEPKWPLAVAMSVAANLIWYRVALHLANKPERFTQTMIALFAVSVVFLPPIYFLQEMLLAQQAANEEPSAMVALLLFGLATWGLVVNLRIVKSAFEWPWPPVIILVVAQGIASLLLLQALFPASAPPPK
jgi:hypothetical protein